MRRSPPRYASRWETSEPCCAGRKRACARRRIVRHLSDGTLRRMVDEPLALTAGDQAHFDDCTECRSRYGAIASSAHASAVLLTVPSFEPQAAVALPGLRAQLAEQSVRPAPFYQRWIDRNAPRMRPLATPLVAVGIATLLVFGVTATGVGGELLRIFEPTQVVPVQVSPSALAPQSLQLDYGAVKWLPAPP